MIRESRGEGVGLQGPKRSKGRHTVSQGVKRLGYKVQEGQGVGLQGPRGSGVGLQGPKGSGVVLQGPRGVNG